MNLHEIEARLNQGYDWRAMSEAFSDIRALLDEVERLGKLAEWRRQALDSERVRADGYRLGLTQVYNLPLRASIRDAWILARNVLLGTKD